jgi:hypothetical protein
MHRYLIVANQTLGGDELVQAVRERILRGPAKFWVLVPATHHSMLRVGYSEVASYDAMENAGSSLAQRRLDEELQRLHDAGADADGEVGDEDPLKAIGNTLARQRFDEIILSTMPEGLSRWLRMDLPSRVQRKFSIPIAHVVTEPPS